MENNWRLIIKSLFADLVATALGSDVKKFGAWNNQVLNIDTNETIPELSVFFEYSAIGDGLEYLNLQDFQQTDRIPVEITLHIVFNDYSESFQDSAYHYAHLISSSIVGQKHACIHGRIQKFSEVEDINHTGQYQYQITFGMQIKELFELAVALEDANPETTDNPNHETGRRLKTSITFGPQSVSIFQLTEFDRNNITLNGSQSTYRNKVTGDTQGIHFLTFKLGQQTVSISGAAMGAITQADETALAEIGLLNATGTYSLMTLQNNPTFVPDFIGEITVEHSYRFSETQKVSTSTIRTIGDRALRFTIDTRNTQTESTSGIFIASRTENNKFNFPLIRPDEPLRQFEPQYNFLINWGDGTSDTITNSEALDFNNTTHTYDEAGIYTVEAIGTIVGYSYIAHEILPLINGMQATDAIKVISFENYGCPTLVANSFSRMLNIAQITAKDLPANVLTANDITSGTFGGYLRHFRDCRLLTDEDFESIVNYEISDQLTLIRPFQGCRNIETLEGLKNWDVSNVTVFFSMFINCDRFIGESVLGWEMSQAENIGGMFANCLVFNQDIGTNWNIKSNLTNLTSTFFNTQFNYSLDSWDFSGITTLFNTFGSCPFNQDVSNWNTQSLTNIRRAFQNNTSFDQNLANWDISSVTDAREFLNGGGLSTANYDATLIGWAAQTVQPNVQIDFGISKYTLGGAAEAAVNTLDANGWIITDGGGV